MNTNTIVDDIRINTILILTLFTLLVAHATLGDSGRDLLFGGFVIIAILIILAYLHITIFSRNIYYILIIIYISMHFPIFLTGGGGIFNLVAAGLLPLIIFFKARDWEFKEKKIWVLMSILCIINVIGYIFGELSTEHIINGAVAFTGVITIFYIAQGVVLTKYRIKILIISAAILGLVNLFVTINTNYKFIEINSPLLFSLYKKANYQYLVNTGTINTAEIFGEWAMLNAFLLLPFVFMIQGNDYFRINEKFLITLGFLSSYLCAFLSFSKSVIILSLAGFFLFFIYSAIKSYQPMTVFKFILLILFSVIFLPLISTALDLTYIFDRFYENQDFLKNFLQNPLTGEGTSREQVYLLGLARITENNWIIGNGFSVPEGNMVSWFGSFYTGESFVYADFHNLYFCLIPIWGYLGTFIFVLILIMTIWQLFKNIKKLERAENDFLISFMSGLLFIFLFFLINEYKTNALRNSYFTIVIIWLGLAVNANSIAKGLIYDQKL